MGRDYTPVIEKRGDLYLAKTYELPGVESLGSTPEEARRLLEAALAQLGKSNREFASRLRARSSKRKRE
jgi:predicted RNase H-like HicB family nuclease